MRSLRATATALAVTVSLLPLSATPDIEGNQLPDFGDSSGSLISPAQEQALGEAFMRSIRSQVPLVTDPLIDSYIIRLGNKLVANSDAPGYPFTFFVVEDKSVNAFAGPGGYIGVHTGLITTAHNESELAGVLAHEIAHVTQRHLIRAYESASQMSLPTAAAMLAGILLGMASGNADAGVAAVTAVQAGSIQRQLNFTRANEKEADRIGIQTLARSGIDPFGMPAFFERLYQSTRLYGSNQIPEFLSTHPVTSDRIAESVSRAEKAGRGKSNDSRDFQLTRARLEVELTKDPPSVLSEYQALVKSNPTPAHRYGLALAYQKNSQPSAARKEMQALLADDPDRTFYRVSLAELELESGQADKAMKIYRDTLALYPGDMVVSQYYAAALIRTGHAGQARKLVVDMMRDPRARTEVMYQLWAKATSISGPAWETKQATAEIYFMNGGINSAIDQLQQALEIDGISQFEQARIQARLNEFKQAASERE